jgi:hypothetical protein
MTLKHISLLTLFLVLLGGCRKDEDEPDTPAPGAVNMMASDAAMLEDAYTDAMEQVDEAADANGLRGTDDECAPVVTFDTIASPHTITVDFGPVNCTALNGRMRRGRLQVSYTGRYRDAGTVITITPEDYYVNNNRLEGTKVVTNMGLNGDGDPYFNVVVNATLTAGDGSWTASHQATRVRTWVNGSDTEDLLDDEYTVTGSGTGVSRAGDAYTLNITNALHVRVLCPYITQGTFELTPDGGPVYTVDYGDGACNAMFTVSVNGVTYSLYM